MSKIGFPRSQHRPTDKCPYILVYRPTSLAPRVKLHLTAHKATFHIPDITHHFAVTFCKFHSRPFRILPSTFCMPQFRILPIPLPVRYIVDDCKQLEKVQCQTAHFVKRDYRSTTSVSSLISQLGWQTLSGRLSHTYKSVHGLTGISTSSFRCSSKHTSSADGDTFYVLSSRTDP